jgi:hemerythrin-like domain-containing protein
MKRDPALVSLSHDHHQALFVARELKRATGETAAEARAAFLGYWNAHGRTHFRLEEEVLFPAYAGYGDSHHPLLARALCDHVAIRHRAAALAGSATPSPSTLRAIGARLADHVRLEERELFPLIERAMPRDALSAVAAELEHAEELLAGG